MLTKKFNQFKGEEGFHQARAFRGIAETEEGVLGMEYFHLRKH